MEKKFYNTNKFSPAINNLRNKIFKISVPNKQKSHSSKQKVPSQKFSTFNQFPTCLQHKLNLSSYYSSPSFFLTQSNFQKANLSIFQAHSAIPQQWTLCHLGSEKFVKLWKLFGNSLMQWILIWKKKVTIYYGQIFFFNSMKLKNLISFWGVLNSQFARVST